MGNVESACSSANASVVRAQEKIGKCCVSEANDKLQTERVARGVIEEAMLEEKLEMSAILEILRTVELFNKLPQSEHAALAKICVQRGYRQGGVLMHEGESGDALYIITKGVVSVKVDGKLVAKMSTGECVGERALLRNEPRAATITAESLLSVIMITQAQFEESGLKKKLVFKSRQAIGGGAEQVVEHKTMAPKTDQDKKQIRAAIQANKNLQGMVPLTQAQCQLIAELCWNLDVKCGEQLIKQGDESENALFYMVRNGQFDVRVLASTGELQYSGQIAIGGSFGELALIYGAPRAATVTALVDSSLWVIDRVRFQNIISDTSKEKTQRYLECIEKASFFDRLSAPEKLGVANNLLEMDFERGETIFEQGEIGHSFYILYDGEVEVVKNGKQVAKLAGTKDKAAIFGELALLHSEPRAATIKVVSEVARTMYMENSDFDLLLGAMKTGQSCQSQLSMHENSPRSPGISLPSGDASDRMCRQDFENIGILGCGGFGVVHLVLHKKTKKEFALKSLSKGHIIKCKMKESVMREKTIQMLCDSPFIIKLYATFKEEQALLFLMEVALGGELYDIYERNGLHGSEPHAKFYVASVVLAFDYMHSKKIIYRDLKPENLLLTVDGKLKVTDMGLAKVVVGKTRTVCGTPDYFAPEMIAREGYSVALDWWTLGILTYELMVGKAPFAGDGNVLVQIKKGFKLVKFPLRVQGVCEDFIKALCETKPSSRLPMRKGGSDNIKSHEWFRGMRWDALINCSIEPPFIPEVKSVETIRETVWSRDDIPPQLPYIDDGTGWDDDFESSRRGSQGML